MSQKHVLENIQAVIQNAVPKIPGKWSNVRCIAIKTPTSMSLPFYNKTPEELVAISKMAGLEQVKVVQVKATKETKQKLAAKSPLLQALKKQKKLESEQKSETKSTKKEKTEATKKATKSKDESKKSEKKHKKKRSMSAEVQVKETVVVESKKAKVDFVASKKFKGSKKGYVFRAGRQGVGYYVDVKPVVDRMAMEALKQSAAQQSRGGGRRKKGGKRGRR